MKRCTFYCPARKRKGLTSALPVVFNIGSIIDIIHFVMQIWNHILASFFLKQQGLQVLCHYFHNKYFLKVCLGDFFVALSLIGIF